MKTYEHRVVGIGRFPIDMLRCDECHPKTEGDSNTITGTHNAEGPARSIPSVQVTVVSPRRVLTRLRWQSFGWDLAPGNVSAVR